jgi:hypothetical protein
VIIHLVGVLFGCALLLFFALLAGLAQEPENEQRPKADDILKSHKCVGRLFTPFSES